MSNLRMNAYYFSFNKTKSHDVDKVLSAICDAGKGYHHTESWSDVSEYSDDGKSHIDKIQDRANEVSELIEKLQSQLEAANKVIDIYGFALGVIEGGDDGGDCETALEAIEKVEKIRNGGEV